MNTTAIILIVFAIIMISRHKRDRRYLHDRLAERDQAHSNRPALPDTSSLEREVGDLRERIRVLERIVTDCHNSEARESRRISDEIEALRDREHS